MRCEECGRQLPSGMIVCPCCGNWLRNQRRGDAPGLNDSANRAADNERSNSPNEHAAAMKDVASRERPTSSNGDGNPHAKTPEKTSVSKGNKESKKEPELESQPETGHGVGCAVVLVLLLITAVLCSAVITGGHPLRVLDVLGINLPFEQDDAQSLTTEDSAGDDSTGNNSVPATIPEGDTTLVVYPTDTPSDGYVLPYADSRYYTAEELSELDVYGLFVARNEIFARHGYIFKSEELESYFESKNWYVPKYTAEEYEALSLPMNDFENQNIQTILDIEQAMGSPYI